MPVLLLLESRPACHGAFVSHDHDEHQDLMNRQDGYISIQNQKAEGHGGSQFKNGLAH